MASPPAASRGARSASAPPPPEPSLDRALALVMELMAIPGPSCQERAIAECVQEKLRSAGVPASALHYDEAHRRSPAGGETGNLIVRLPGTHRGPRRMLMAHLDTVPLCVGCLPERRGEYIESANPQTGLGADNRSGVAVVLGTALEILERRLPHPPLTLLFTVQEELGLFGARYVEVPRLGQPQLAWNWDARGPHRITLAATGGHTLRIIVRGIASHAGGAPECGVSAIAVAGLAIADLVSRGWHGDIRRGRRHGTCNLGIIRGGDSTNTVTDRVEILGECRSYQRPFRELMVRQVSRAFARAAARVRNESGERGQAECTAEVEYEAFRLSSRAPSVREAARVIRALGREPELLTSNGALDANWLNFQGIPTATLGAGQVFGHSVRECLDIEQFHTACRVALRLATAHGQ